MSAPIVGIIANPVSARDIRRVIAHAGNLQIVDRANMVLRILAGLAATGIERVLMMPEKGGIRGHLLRAMAREANRGGLRLPEVSYLEMPVTGGPADSAAAARAMKKMAVAAIVILGGDGTHRIVVSECGQVPIAGVSTGTNNAFAKTQEPTIVGLAVGLAARAQVPPELAFRLNKRLDVAHGDQTHIAIVDVAVVRDSYVGARALWRSESFQELFVAFGEPDGIGMSAIAGLLCPVSRREPEGRRLILAAGDSAPISLSVPIAPGLIEPIGIESFEPLFPDRPVPLISKNGSIALDGEREFTFTAAAPVSVTLRLDAFRTIDTRQCMAFAAKAGLLTGAVPAAVECV